MPKKKAKLAIFLDPNNVSGAKYVEKKVQLAKRLGVEIVMNKIDGSEDGIMVQLPHPNAKELISQIPPEKDVDGLRENSPFQPAVVRAVIEIINSQCSIINKKMLVVGAKGFVGKNLLKLFPNAVGMDIDDFDPDKVKDFDVVISATGVPELIKEIKNGAVAIDVGYPQGDFDPSVADKAALFTPVPGGVGPVTVAMLFANLVGSRS